MARPLRIEFAGAQYHIAVRGNERQDIYFTDEDRQRFFVLFHRACDTSAASVDYASSAR